MARASREANPFRPPGSRSDLLPVYVLQGEELLREESLKQILAIALSEDERSFNLDVLSAVDVDIRDALARASAFPMMAERRAVVLQDVEKLRKDELDLLTHYVERPMESTILILTAEKVDLRKNPFSKLKQQKRVFEFGVPTGEELTEWIAGRLAAKGRSMEDGAARLLASFAGSSLRDLDQEIDKLVLYAGDRPALTETDVAMVSGISKEYNIWELQRAIAAGDCRRSVEIVTRMIEDGYRAPYFVVMLTTFFAAVRRTHDLRRRGMGLKEVAGDFKRMDFQVRDQFSATERFSVYEVERALALLLSVDDQVKFGGDDLTLLQTMLVEVLHSPSMQQ